MTHPFQVGKMYRKDGKTVTPLAAFLADKQTMRVSVMMRDGETNSACPDCAGSGLYPSSVRCPTCHGTGIDPANTTGDRASLTDAEIQMRDHIARDSAWRTETAGSRPGYRTVADSEERRAAQQKIADAHEEYNRYITTAYRDVSPDVNWSVGQGSPSKNFGKPAPDGSACTLSDGRPGHIVNGECVASSEDNRTVTQVAVDHAQNMESVYQEHANFLENAWRNLK